MTYSRRIKATVLFFSFQRKPRDIFELENIGENEDNEDNEETRLI